MTSGPRRDSPVASRAQRLFRQHDGPLTRDLSRTPGGFGLGQVPARLKPSATSRVVCGFCSTGCSLDIHLRGGQAINVSPTREYSVNTGKACPKGWEALTPLRSKDRATMPLLLAYDRLVPVSWATAIDAFVSRFKAIQARYGGESVAFLGSGQMPSEELALLGALGKFGMGMVHGDGNPRQGTAAAALAYEQAFGFDAPPYTFRDLEESDVLVFVGANPCVAHPIMWGRVCKNAHDPTIVVVDPRRTETAMAADLHLPLRPKSDLTLLYGVARLLFERGWVDRGFLDTHTSGSESFAAHVAPYALTRVAAETGLAPEAIAELAAMIHRGKRVSFWWTTGVNQSHEGVRVAQAIVNLALMTGNIGRPGTGANSIAGQCNALGSRLFANTASLLGGHDFGKADDRAKVARTLGIDPACVPSESSLAYDQIVEGIHRGRIRGLWIVGTNTAHSWINQADLHDLLGRLDFLVVQDMYTTTETAQRAHLVLPAAGWGEKEGTFVNSERRIGLIKRVASAPGEALADFYILKLIAEAWGCGEMFRRWSSPEEVFRILAELTRGQPCEITGLDGYGALEALGGVQWPMPEGACVAPGSERRLFEDGQFFHPDGRARFYFGDPKRSPEPTDARYPFTLLTGRGGAAQWDSLTRTSKSSVLEKLGARAAYVEISPVDAADLGICADQEVVVESRRGKMTARAFVTHGIQPKQVFVPMHYACVNRLTVAAFDPYSRQPAYKACAVSIRALREGEKSGI